MALISLQDISLAFGGPPVFDRLNFQLEAGERVALLGRNGAGKTTLMKVMAGHITPDEGDVVYQKGIRVTHLPQEVPVDLEGTVFDVVLSGLGERVKLVSDYHHISHRLQTEYSEALMRELGRLQSEMDRTEAWHLNRQIEETIERMKLDPESRFETLSGGQKRRALLARALVLEPEVLMLDEPTNHLDIESIEWLEGFLKEYKGTLFFVTHDRVFLQHMATRIAELDRGKLFSWACDYHTFLERKEMALENEAAERAKFEKKMAQEEVWIRQGIKARRARNEGRVNALMKMREQKRAQRDVVGKVRMQAQEADASGHIVSKTVHLTYAWETECLVRDLTLRIMRGDKIGVIGPNGSGKTTLLRLLLGQLEPLQGTVSLGTNLQIAYYDQLREQLDESKTVAQNVCGSGDTVFINGKPKNIMGYLQDFLFSPERARTPVKVLSGGERNRLVLARLFTKPSNLLVMDEPTNDLDIETLELLEELLAEYSGTLLLVSHDRAFLNNVVTSTLVLEGHGVVREYPGGYDDWLSQSAARRKVPGAGDSGTRVKSPAGAPGSERLNPAAKGRKLSYEEKRELAAIPLRIEKLEAEQADLYKLMADPAFYQNDAQTLAETSAQADRLARELLALYQRWEQLEAVKG